MRRLICALTLATFWIRGPNDLWAQETPNFVSPNACPAPARLAIDALKLPKAQIHSCAAEAIDLETQSASLIRLAYGPPQSCSTGCVYQRYVGVVVPGNPLEVVELPESDSFLNGLVALMKPQGKTGMVCDPISHLFDFEVVRHHTTEAWHVKLKAPYRCKWSGPENGQSSTTGNFFVYRDGGHQMIETDHLVTHINAPIPEHPSHSTR